MSSPSIVRRALPADRDSIWDLYRLNHAENGLFRLCEPKVNWYLDRILHPERIAPDDPGARGFIGVIGPPTALEGLLMMMLGSYWYSDELYLEEYTNFVHPDHRKSNHAKTLLSWSKHMQQKTNIPLVIGIISNHRTEAKVRLYRRFLPEAGAFFLVGATTGTNRERPTGG